jgi:hypothetical protein
MYDIFEYNIYERFKEPLHHLTPLQKEDLLKEEENQNRFHILALALQLPEDFEEWELLDEYGDTVAHVAAKSGALPEGFNRWDLMNHEGETVAHVAAKTRLLVLHKKFNQWEMVNKKGETVAEVFVDKVTLSHISKVIDLALTLS